MPDDKVVNPYTRQVVAAAASGDRNDAANYTLICSCGRELGSLAGYRVGGDGRRAARCAFTSRVVMSLVGAPGDGKAEGCGRITLVGPTGQIEGVLEPEQAAQFLRSQAARVPSLLTKEPSPPRGNA